MDILTAYPRDPTVPRLERGVIINYHMHEYDALHHIVTYLREIQLQHSIPNKAMPAILGNGKHYTCRQCLKYFERNSALHHPFVLCFIEVHTLMFQGYADLLELEYEQRRENYEEEAEEDSDVPPYFLNEFVALYFRKACEFHFPDRAHMQ